MYVFIHKYKHTYKKRSDARYGVARISRFLKIIGLFCRISSLSLVSFTKETYNFKEPTIGSQPISIGSRLHVFALTYISTYMHAYIHTYIHACTQKYTLTYTNTNPPCHTYIHTNNTATQCINQKTTFCVYIHKYTNEHFHTYKYTYKQHSDARYPSEGDNVQGKGVEMCVQNTDCIAIDAQHLELPRPFGIKLEVATGTIRLASANERVCLSSCLSPSLYFSLFLSLSLLLSLSIFLSLSFSLSLYHSSLFPSIFLSRSLAGCRHKHYGVAPISRLLKIIGLFCRISSVL